MLLLGYAEAYPCNDITVEEVVVSQDHLQPPGPEGSHVQAGEHKLFGPRWVSIVAW